MLSRKIELLRSIKTFTQLVKYLRDELDWPIESDNFDDLMFDYEPEELGIDAKTAVKIKEIKQLRPLSSKQPWGIFFINFEPKQLPIVVLRRILRSLVIKKRASANRSQQAAWKLHDLLFISSYGEFENRELTFAHFSEPDNRLFGDLPTLRVLGWDDDDTKLKMDHVVHTLSEKMRWPEDEGDAETWRRKWSNAFELRPREVINTSKDLAIRLADLAKSIRQRANLILDIESETGSLRKMHKAFQTALIHNLNQDDFADMYAQTIAYGLLAARVSRPAGIVADNLADMVPITNPFLKDMLSTFLSIGGRKGKIDFDELGIQEVVDLLNNPDTHMEAILRDFGKRTMQEDPVIHFYELFLKEYDKKKKVERGVFYTPQPVVSYIIRSVHELLQKEFGLEDGLASTITWGEMAKLNPHIKIPEGVSPDEHFVQMLDPATGTATFLVEIIEVIYQTMISKWRKEKFTEFELGDLWNEYVPKHLLPRLYGFELMMAPYAIAHMKIGLKLAETGYKFSSNERAHIYLTNSLEPPSDMAEQPEFEEWSPALAHEAKAVNAVKRKKRFTVVVGNPPYSKISSNLTPEMRATVERYRFSDGERIKERGALQFEINLQDDYVKFFRFSEEQIVKSSCGILGLITNNGYFSTPTLRGMRDSLLESFGVIRALDLHGHIAKGELGPDNASEENVFDILQGVAVFLGSKLKEQAGDATVLHAHCYGMRTTKYGFLYRHTQETTKFTPIAPAPPFYLFVPHDADLTQEWGKSISLKDILPQNSAGIITARDGLVIAEDRGLLADRIKSFCEAQEDEAIIYEKFGFSESKRFDLLKAQRELRSLTSFSEPIRCLLHRPFDERFIFFHPSVIWSMSRPMADQMKNCDNVALVATRQVTRPQFEHAFVTRHIIEIKACSHDRNTQIFPLVISNAGGGLKLTGGSIANINKAFMETFSNVLGLTLRIDKCTIGEDDEITPLRLFNFIYAILHSPIYRARYYEFLRSDFPRIPQTSNLTLFKQLAVLGGELVALHLMEFDVVGATRRVAQEGQGSALPLQKTYALLTTFINPVSPVVEKVSYSDNTVWIDKAKTQGFQGVPENVWNFHIGGYQVCQKWLKDRGPKGGKPGRILSADDINHYHRIVVALNETIRIMAEIDKVIEQHGGWPRAFQGKEEEKKEYKLQTEQLQKVAEKKPSYQPEKTFTTKQLLFPKKNDWKTWAALSVWAKTAPVNTYWIDFAATISNKIKKDTKLSQKDQEEMKKCWRQAVKNGFKI